MLNKWRTAAGLYFASIICFKVLIKLFIKPLMIVNPSKAVQALLADFFPVHVSKLLTWHACLKLNTVCTGTQTYYSRGIAYMVIAKSGSWPMLSAASKEFSTSSLMLVYRHLPGCSSNACLLVQD